MKREHALKLRAMIEKAAASLDDKDASLAPELFRKLKQDGSLVDAFTRINWKGKIKISNNALWDMEQYDPDHAPTLWDDLQYRDGIRIIPEVIYLAQAFSKDEIGWWGDVIYRSKKDINVYPPPQAPDDWEVYQG